jgi:hypothetical protein
MQPSEQGRPEISGHRELANDLAPRNKDILQIFRPWLVTFLRAVVKIANNFWRNCFACGNPSLLALYF